MTPSVKVLIFTLTKKKYFNEKILLVWVKVVLLSILYHYSSVFKSVFFAVKMLLKNIFKMVITLARTFLKWFYNWLQAWM